MDNSEKEILENLKNFDTKILLTKESYVEISVQGNCYQAYVLGIKQNEQLIQFLLNEEDEKKRTYFQSLFNLTFLDCVNHFIENTYFTELNGLKLFNEMKNDDKELLRKKVVWFRIEQYYNKYYISMYYDNVYNQANGEDL